MVAAVAEVVAVVAAAVVVVAAVAEVVVVVAAVVVVVAAVAEVVVVVAVAVELRWFVLKEKKCVDNCVWVRRLLHLWRLWKG